MNNNKLIVVALGGNAIQKPGQDGTAEEQFANISSTCGQLAQLLISGYQLVLTHGNGPQVGAILLQNEAAREQVPPMPLDICGAQSQGFIGYMFQQALKSELQKRDLYNPVVSVVTQTQVDSEDPAFDNPTKPIGSFYSEEEAQTMQQQGIAVNEDAGRGYRRVVASPDPQAIVEIDAIAKLVQDEVIVIASGGGGIPVTKKGKELHGIEAVIDKDLAANRLAQDVGADILLILTDVAQVQLNYGTEEEKPIKKMTVEEAEQYQREGHFKEGSMKPKVLAGMRFARTNPEGRAIIAGLNCAVDAVEGKSGTEIVQ